MKGNERCQEWVRSRCRSGYGKLVFKGVSMLAHRVVYEDMVGSIPDGMCVLHHCDNPSCINPDHLYVGTPADNAADRVRRGREGDRRGELHGRTSLTDQDVFYIRASNKSQKELAAIYGITQSSISKILLRQTWGHI